jgi:NADH:ubiquinone oxidoreductase subunit E
MTEKLSAANGARTGLLSELKEALKENRCLSRATMKEIAEKCGLPVNEVYGVSSFYSYLPVRPAGAHVIRVCEALPCDLKEAGAVLAHIEELLGIKPGETTADGKFSLEVVGCIGACDEAPAMMIDDTLFGRLTKDKIAEILSTY